MQFDDLQLHDIYDSTSGYCHICHKKLARKNYGVLGAKGAWEVDHSNPRANGGTDRLCNLFAACISCNRSKGASSSKVARYRNGKKRAPISQSARKRIRKRNVILGVSAGIAVGRVFGPLGIAVGGFIGAALGNSAKIDK